MNTIITATAVKTEIKKVNVQSGLLSFSAFDKVTYVYFSNGNKITYGSAVSFVSNERLDSWENIKKAQKTGSEKNKIAFIQKHLNSLIVGLKLD